MKKLLTIFMLLTASLPLWAYDLEVDGIYYDFWNNRELKVTNTDYQARDYSGDVVIPTTVSYDGVTYVVSTIGQYAFMDCTELTSVTIPESVQEIWGAAFAGCTGLTSITIPASVDVVQADAFGSCTGLTEVVIQANLTSLASHIFYGCTGLTSITIPESVTSIGDGAFDGCTALSSVNIPDNVTEIGERAFYGCKLTSITIPDSVNSLGRSAFEGCDDLTEVTIGSGLTSVGENVFGHCSALTSIVVDENNTTYDSRENCNAIIETATGKLVHGCTSTVIPEGVTTIGKYAFYYMGLTHLELPSTITTIEEFACIDFATLDSITCNATTPPTVAENSFSYEDATTLIVPLQSVNLYKQDAVWGQFNIPVSYTELSYTTSGTDATVVYNENYSNYSIIIIPPSVEIDGVTYNVTSIGNYAFNNCTGLTSIIIPASVTSIGDYAFSGCTALKEVIMEDGETTLRLGYNGSNGGLFIDCPLETLYMGRTLSYDSSSSGRLPFNAKTTLTSVTLGDNVTSIGNHAFRGCTGLTEITIPESVTSIGNCAFDGCTGLTEITIPESVTSLGNAFGGCTGLTEITIPESVTSIITRTFYGCTGLTSVTIGNSVTSIGSYAFNNCTGLTEITIPESVTSIDEWAFQNCNSLTSVTIGNGVTSIHGRAFYGCTISEIYFDDIATICNGAWEALPRASSVNYYYKNELVTDVVIPDSITSIGNNAFQNCNSLTSVTIGNSVTSIGNNAFENCIGLTSVTIPESATSIGNNTFKNCTGLTSVTIGNGVTSIGDYAFYHCTGLASITIGNGVTSIGSYAFTGCAISEIYFDDIATLCNGVWDALSRASSVNYYYKNELVTELVIPDSITTIGKGAFYGCTGLTSVTIPASVTSIDSYAFHGCTGLTSVTIPASVTSIGTLTFGNCTGLKTVNFNAENCMSMGSGFNDGVFDGCNNITTINIGDAVKNIPDYAFLELDNLKNLTLGNSVTSIGGYAFYGCTGLTSVTIPESVTSIGVSAFSECSALKELILEDGENVLDLDQPFKSYQYLQITTLYLGRTLSYSGGDYSFSYLESLTIGNTVTSIGRSAFTSSKLTGMLELPASLDSIASNAFSHTKYTSCHILAPEPPVVVDSAAMGNIDFVRVPNGAGAAYRAADVWKDLTIIEEDPEYEVEITVTEPGKISQDIVMEYMIVPQSITKLKVHGTINADDFKQMRTNMTSCYSIDLSDANCVALPDSAFEGKYYLTELILPNNCQSIGNAAFVNCTGLDTVTIPDNVTAIGDDVFYGCNGLKSITIGYNVVSIGANAFYGCIALKSITIPNSVTSLGANAFRDCIRLQTIKLSQNLTAIKSSTFDACLALKEINIPGSVTTIENGAFDYCEALERVVLEDGEKTLYLGYMTDSGVSVTRGKGLFYSCPITTLYIGRNLSYNNAINCGYSPFYKLETNVWGTVFLNGKISSVTFGDKVTNISNNLLGGSPTLKSVKLGANISSISSSAFSYTADTLDIDYSNLSVLYKCGDVINNSHKVNLYNNGVPVTHIDLPYNMTTVKTNQFKNVINLQSINIPNSVKNINDNAFEACVSMMSVAFSDSITTIGNQAFMGCVSLTTVNLPDTLTTIGNYAFKGCTSLTTVNLSDTLQSIGNEAFYGCEALANITCPALVPPTVGTDGFEGVDNYTCILTIPGDSLINYMLAEHWGAFIQKRKRIDVTVDEPVVEEDGEDDAGSGESGEGTEESGKGHLCGGRIWYDRDWHKHHRGHHAPRRYATAEEETAVNGIDATIGDGLSLFIATDSVVTFYIEPEAGYEIGSVQYGGVDVTDQLNNGVFTTTAVSDNTSLKVSFVEENASVVAVPGDANGDNLVNVADVVVVVNYILGDETGVTSAENADVNGDDIVNVGDAVSIINIVLGDEVAAAPAHFQGAKGTLTMNDVVIAMGETRSMSLCLDNEMPYTAFQVDVTMPQGLTAHGITLSNRLASSHSLMWREQLDGTLRVVVFALDNAPIADNHGALLSIDVTADATFEGGNIVVSEPLFVARDLTLHRLDDVVAGAVNPAGVDGVYTTDRIYTVGRTIVVESTCEQPAYITTAGGVMRTVELQAGRNEIGMAQQGMYIVVVGAHTEKVIIR